MKVTYILYLVILFFTISCKESSDNKVTTNRPEVIKLGPVKTDSKYLLNPPKSDTLCISDVERAKRDIDKYGKLFIRTICFGCDAKPFQAEIEEVLKKKKIKEVIEDIGCVVFEGQTQGCYSDFIILKMKELYGENYFSNFQQLFVNFFRKRFDVNFNFIHW